MKTITKTSMITGLVINVTDFTSEKKAIAEFKAIVDALGYDNTTVEKKTTGIKMEAGGRGHDLRIELEINNLVAD